jgi:metal-sulfur cluster biosynthetic enzyme
MSARDERIREVYESTLRTRHASPHGEGASADARYRSDDPALQRLWSALREVMDPELPISLVDLGLFHGVARAGTQVSIDITFTATACPCMEFIHEDIRERLLREPDVEAVEIRHVWDPPWTTDRMTAEGRALLGKFGVAA